MIRCGSQPPGEKRCGISRSQILHDSASPSVRHTLGWKFPYHILGRAASNFVEDRGTQLAGAISYFTLFALFPATLLLVSIFGIVLRDEVIQLRVLNALIDYLPIEGSIVADSLRQVADLGPSLTILSLAGSVWTAGALSAAIRQALNQVFEVEARRPLLRAKLVDFVLLPVIAVPLIGGIVFTAMLRFFQVEIQDRFGILDGRFAWTWDAVSLLVPLTMSFVAFAALYRLAPNREQPLKYLWPGALFAALAFEGLKAGFGFYLETFGAYSLYGSLGSVIVLLFWIYLTANILVFGAEIANEVPHVLHHDPHPSESGEGDLKRALWHFVRGLILVQDDTIRPRHSRATAQRLGELHFTPRHPADASDPVPELDEAEAKPD